MHGRSHPLNLIPSINGLKVLVFASVTLLVTFYLQVFLFSSIMVSFFFFSDIPFSWFCSVSVWKYDSGKDSVLQVNKEGYVSCNISNPIEEYKDGNTKVKLSRSGPFYFISGTKGNCEKGQKLVVVVLSPRNRYTGISPAPAPVEFDGPAVAPTSSATKLQSGLLVALGIFVLGLFWERGQSDCQILSLYFGGRGILLFVLISYVIQIQIISQY